MRLKLLRQIFTLMTLLGLSMPLGATSSSKTGKVDRLRCEEFLQSTITSTVAEAFAPGSNGYFIADLKGVIPESVRNNFETNLTQFFEETYKDIPLPTAPFRRAIVTDWEGLCPGYNNMSEERKNASKIHLKVILPVILEIISDFYYGLPTPIEPDTWLAVSEIDLRSYYTTEPEVVSSHPDGGADYRAFTFSPNDNGTIVEVKGQRIRPQSWDLVGISDTLHASPQSKIGRLFIRVSFLKVTPKTIGYFGPKVLTEKDGFEQFKAGLIKQGLIDP